jgi:hypothetical protein
MQNLYQPTRRLSNAMLTDSSLEQLAGHPDNFVVLLAIVQPAGPM